VFPKHLSVHIPEQKNHYVDLTQVMQNVLENFPTNNANVILRCDHLPEVTMNEHDATTLCTLLLQSILQTSTSNKLFLYIKCEEEEPEVINLGNKKNYTISFHTNFVCDEQWKKKNENSLQQCAAIISGHGGKFVYNDAVTAGCLFLVTLPGKPS
jgi:hypothetical protein